ncbi:MAG: hypothetical protein FWD13_04995 [Treponema sp.]|nr:hypothetical protein [Treponema sp.]
MKLSRIRLFIDKNTSAKERVKIINSAVEDKYDTLVFSLDDNIFKTKNWNQKYLKLIRRYAFNIEAGGHNLPLMLPRRLYMSDKELFRMDQGKRIKDHHFCPTNPKTIAIIANNSRKLFADVLQVMTAPRIFHMLPDEGHERTWCACPACRAFRFSEQFLIAVNTAADELIKLDPEAKIMYVDIDTEPEAARIMPRKNTFIDAKKN